MCEVCGMCGVCVWVYVEHVWCACVECVWNMCKHVCEHVYTCVLNGVISIQYSLGFVSGQVHEEEMGASCVGKKRKIAPGIGASKRQGHKAKEDARCSHGRIQLLEWRMHRERSEGRLSQALSLGKKVSTFPAM